jgi:hypothetical protein
LTDSCLEFRDDTYQIPRNSSVVVRRVPAPEGTATRYLTGLAHLPRGVTNAGAAALQLSMPSQFAPPSQATGQTSSGLSSTAPLPSTVIELFFFFHLLTWM